MSHQVRGSREQVHNDVELELQEAMAENVFGEESLLDGETCLAIFLWLRNFCSKEGSSNNIILIEGKTESVAICTNS